MKKLIKIISLIIVISLNINTFSAVVADNDGSAFITKPEFDSLKNDFQSRLDSYNSSIDSKIDNAISSYLSGLKISKKSEVSTLNPGRWECVNEKYVSSDYTWRLKYGSPKIAITFQTVGAGYSFQNWVLLGIYGNVGYPEAPSGSTEAQKKEWEKKYLSHKLLVTNISETNKVVEWYGIGYGCSDKVRIYNQSWATLLAMGTGNMYISYFRPQGVQRRNSIIDQKITNWGLGTDSTGQDLQTEFNDKVKQHSQDFGTIKNKKIILLNGSRKYLNFALYPNQRNWGFYYVNPTGETLEEGKNYEKLWQTLNSGGLTMASEISNCWNLTSGSFSARGAYNNNTTWTNDGKQLRIISRYGGGGRTDTYGTQQNYCLFPGPGFEDNYIKDWNQLYTTYFDDVAKDAALNSSRLKLLSDDKGIDHVGIVNGVPLIRTEKDNTKVTLEIDIENIYYELYTGDETKSDPTTDCYVWISQEPFIGDPNDEDCLDFTPVKDTCRKTTTAGFTKAVEIPASQKGKATVEFIVPDKEKYVWIKWSVDGKNGGGAFNIPRTVITEVENS